MASKIMTFIGKNTVMVIAFLAAVLTAIFVPPDTLYIGYFDFKTLTCLFFGADHPVLPVRKGRALGNSP